MNTAIKEKNIIKKNFDKSASTYSFSSLVQQKCSYVLLELLGKKEYSTILEIGCGTGQYTKSLSTKHTGSEIEAIDLSEKMIHKACEELTERKVQFFCADAENYVPKKKYDLITSNCSLQWFKELQKNICRLKRYLTDGGELLFSVYGPETFNELACVLRNYFGTEVSLQAQDFVPLENIKRVLQNEYEILLAGKEIFKICHSSLLELLQNIKRCGMRGKGLENKKYFLKKDLIEMNRIYHDTFGGISATHEVGFFHVKKK